MQFDLRVLDGAGALFESANVMTTARRDHEQPVGSEGPTGPAVIAPGHEGGDHEVEGYVFRVEAWCGGASTCEPRSPVTAPVNLDDWFRPVAVSQVESVAPDGELTQPVEIGALFAALAEDEHPSGPLPQAGPWPPVGGVPASPAGLDDAWLTQAYEVTLSGALGAVELGFRDGNWYSITEDSARPVSVALAMRMHPDLGGQITALVCWWIRRHAMSERAMDLAAELSLAVTELTHS